MFPVFMAKTTGFLFVVSGVIALLGAFAQINPIWQFGPYTASRISYAVQPDWYMGFLDGALRIWPSGRFIVSVTRFLRGLYPGGSLARTAL